MSKIINMKKLDEMFDVKRNEKEETIHVPEVVSEKEITEEKKQMPEVKVDRELLASLKDDEKLENYIFNKISANIDMGEAILDKLKKSLDDGIISEKMFESAAQLLTAISNSVEQINKVKAWKEKFQIEKAKVAIDAHRIHLGETEDGKNRGGDTFNIEKILITTRENLLDKINEAEQKQGK